MNFTLPLLKVLHLIHDDLVTLFGGTLSLTREGEESVGEYREGGGSERRAVKAR